MFKTSLFVLLVAVSVTMVLSHPGGYGGAVQESKPVGGYGGSGSGFGGAGSNFGSNHDDKLEGYGKPGRPGDRYENNLRDSDSRRHYENERRGGSDSDRHHAPGAYDNDNHRRSGHDSDRQRSGHDGHDSHHAPGAYDNDNHRRGGSGSSRHEQSEESYERGHGGSRGSKGESYTGGSGKYSSGKVGY